jgi:ATP/maltotriose-dependent transcriptional regulator MalT
MTRFVGLSKSMVDPMSKTGSESPGAEPHEKARLIIAPAGFGKTTILMQWQARQRANGATVGGALRPTLALLLDRAAAHAASVVLILDDYHRIAAPGVYRLLGDLISMAPRFRSARQLSRRAGPGETCRSLC